MSATSFIVLVLVISISDKNSNTPFWCSFKNLRDTLTLSSLGVDSDHSFTSGLFSLVYLCFCINNLWLFYYSFRFCLLHSAALSSLGIIIVLPCVPYILPRTVARHSFKGTRVFCKFCSLFFSQLSNCRFTAISYKCFIRYVP